MKKLITAVALSLALTSCAELNNVLKDFSSKQSDKTIINALYPSHNGNCQVVGKLDNGLDSNYCLDKYLVKTFNTASGTQKLVLALGTGGRVTWADADGLLDIVLFNETSTGWKQIDKKRLELAFDDDLENINDIQLSPEITGTKFDITNNAKGYWYKKMYVIYALNNKVKTIEIQTAEDTEGAMAIGKPSKFSSSYKMGRNLINGFYPIEISQKYSSPKKQTKNYSIRYNAKKQNYIVPKALSLE